MRYLFIMPIKFYRYFISPLYPPSCRFKPTCSEFAILAIKKYGAFKGLYFAIKRLSKCHPW